MDFYTLGQETLAPLMSERKKTLRQKLKDNFVHFANKTLKIRTKSGSIEPLELNKAQLYLHEKLEKQRMLKGIVRAIILKGRQQGCSTYIGARFYHRAIHSFGQRVFILTHEQDATNNLFEMVNRYHENCHPICKPHTGGDNAKQLDFDMLDSGYRVGTAGSKAVGRSQTLQMFHGSEVGFWPNANEHAAGIFQAVPNLPGTEIILESTANGMGNFFHQEWQNAEAGLSQYEAIFIPWFWQDEYRLPVPQDFAMSDDDDLYQHAHGLDLEQMAWRSSKIVELKSELLFMQEYPATASEAFQLTGHDSFIPPATVLKARKNKCEAIGPLVLGVDPSWGGEDRFSIAWRRGRVVQKVENRLKVLPVEAANWIRQIIDEDKPDRVFVDVGGGGVGTVDILHNWGGDYKELVVAVNFGSAPQDKPKPPVKGSADNVKLKGGPLNRRAEMWQRSKDWLLDVGEAQIPDLDSLQTDACAPGFTYNNYGQLVIESKKDIKSRGQRSPDEWDSIALTFAEPVAPKKKPIEIGMKKTVNIIIPQRGPAWMK